MNTEATDPRIVSFDLMPGEPDYYFVLTEALRDFAARQRSEAGDYEGVDADARIRWAETAEDALDQIEEALSAPVAIEDVVAASIEQQSVFDNALRHPGMEGYQAMAPKTARRTWTATPTDDNPAAPEGGQ